MLAKINWTFFTNEEEKAQNLVNLIGVIKQEIAATDKAAAEASPVGEEDVDCEDLYNSLYNHAPGVQLTSELDGEATDKSVAEINYDFWNRHFNNKKEVGT